LGQTAFVLWRRAFGIGIATYRISISVVEILKIWKVLKILKYQPSNKELEIILKFKEQIFKMKRFNKFKI